MRILGLSVLIMVVTAIFAPAVASEHILFRRVLKRYVDANGLVDYRGLKADRQELTEYLLTIAIKDPERLRYYNDNDRLAFWINAYNAITLRVIIDHYPIAARLAIADDAPRNSIRQIPGAWDGIQFKVAGQKMTLDHIEHEIIRKEFDEPRIHMALVCAAVSCPPLLNDTYEGDTLQKQLDAQSRRFVRDPTNVKVDRENGKLTWSPIFDWFADDFVKYGAKKAAESDEKAGVIGFIAHYLKRGDRSFINKRAYDLHSFDYDWSLNEQPRD